MDYTECIDYTENIEDFGGCPTSSESGPRCHGCPYSLERVKKALEIAEAAIKYIKAFKKNTAYQTQRGDLIDEAESIRLTRAVIKASANLELVVDDKIEKNILATEEKPSNISIKERLQTAKREIEDACERYGVYLEGDDEGGVVLLGETVEKIERTEVET